MAALKTKHVFWELNLPDPLRFFVLSDPEAKAKLND